MRLGVLFSGGKDSCLALKYARETDNVVCLISLISKNKESYMFHTPNVHLTALQAQAIGLPHIPWETEGEKEVELEDLKAAIAEAVKLYSIEGVVTGAIASEYQATRVQKICDELGLRCINPLWKKEQMEVLDEVKDWEVVVSGVFAEHLDEGWLGERIDEDAISELARLRDKYGINPSGEGGELETTVLWAPFFRKRIVVVDSEIDYQNFSGTYTIKDAKLTNK